jgi:acylphosphatase
VAEVLIRRRVVAHGRVAGVFMRESIRREAESRRIAGWVRNNMDGTVESVFEGEQTPVDRVIVYIDDLDRCPPDVVLRTLESIKLLLDLRNFVVVVGCASSWLIRSLGVMFATMLSTDGGPALEMSPQRYLEKIFQYSLVLPELSQEGFTQLARHLLPPAEVEAAVGPSQGTGPDADLPSDPAPAVAVAHEDPAPTDLVVTEAERDFLTSALWPLFRTPRALKRLTNLYRLIRFSLGSEKVLEDDAYAMSLLLLGPCVGRPDDVDPFFRALQDEAPESSWSQVQAFTQLAPEVAHALTTVRWPGREPQVRDVYRWAPVVTEYTFHPWRNSAS